jgi:hypothetical protein
MTSHSGNDAPPNESEIFSALHDVFASLEKRLSEIQQSQKSTNSRLVSLYSQHTHNGENREPILVTRHMYDTDIRTLRDEQKGINAKLNDLSKTTKDTLATLNTLKQSIDRLLSTGISSVSSNENSQPLSIAHHVSQEKDSFPSSTDQILSRPSQAEGTPNTSENSASDGAMLQNDEIMQPDETTTREFAPVFNSTSFKKATEFKKRNLINLLNSFVNTYKTCAEAPEKAYLLLLIVFALKTDWLKTSSKVRLDSKIFDKLTQHLKTWNLLVDGLVLDQIASLLKEINEQGKVNKADWATWVTSNNIYTALILAEFAKNQTSDNSNNKD